MFGFLFLWKCRQYIICTIQISEDIDESEQWKVAYMTGAANEMYTATLSESFIGHSFQQVAEYVSYQIFCKVTEEGARI